MCATARLRFGSWRGLRSKERDRLTGERTDERRVFFKTAFVFEISPIDVLDGMVPVALEPPCEPLTGDSHAHLLRPFQAFVESLG